jgi:hypothetical protein
MQEKGISILVLSETNTNWHTKNIKKQLSSTTQSIYNNFSIAFSDNRFNPPDRLAYLLGGCLQLCNGHWMSRIIKTIKDPRRMGRWTGHKYRLRDGKTLSVITAYRPCQQSITDATQPSVTVTYQQKLLYTKDKWKYIDPRKIFIQDMIELVQDIENNTYNLCILMWDENESINDPSSAVKKLLTETSLVDAFVKVAGDPGQISTYSRGKKLIDFIFTSQALVPYISRVGYLALYESNLSDHRGMFLDVTESILDTKVILSRPTKSHIESKSKKDIIYK